MSTFRRFAAKVAIAAGLSTAVVVGAAATPAAAYTPYYYGSPGAVSTPRIVGTYLDSVTGKVTFPARTIWKSTRYAGYQQKVCVRYQLVYAMYPATSWQLYSNSTSCAWFSGTSTSLTMPALNQIVNGDPFIYAGNVTVSWYLTNGAEVGRTVLDYNQPGDYSCNYCTIQSSYNLGAYILFL